MSTGVSWNGAVSSVLYAGTEPGTRCERTLSLKKKIGSQIDDPVDKRTYVRELFAGIADRYDLTNDVMSLGLHRRWKHRALETAEIEPGHLVLDLAAGTGDLGRLAFRRSGGDLDVVAADLTVEMLRVGMGREGEELTGWIGADAGVLPFASEAFDRVVVGYGLRNFADLEGCLREILRVLRPGGRFVSLDFGRPPLGMVRHAYLGYLEVSTRLVGLALHRNAESYAYIPESLRRFEGQRGVNDLMEKVGFVNCAAADLVAGTMGINRGDKPPG